MYNYSKIFILAIFLMASNSVSAKSLRATTLEKATQWPGYVAEGDQLYRHNQSTALIVTSIDGLFGIYKLALPSGRVSLLTRVRNPFDIDVAFDDLQFETTNGVTLIDILGQLYATDGSTAGTRLLADYGYSATGGTLGITYSNIHRLTATEGQFYYSVDPDDADDSSRLTLYSTDGTQQGIRQIDLDEQFFYEFGDAFSHQGQVFIFGNAIGSQPSLYTVGDRLVPFNTLSNEDLRFFGIDVVRTSKGIFFCEQGKLWRLSNALTLAVVADNCGDFNYLTTNDDKLFYENDNKIWSSNGLVGDQTLIADAHQLEGGPDFSLSTSCFVDGKLYFNLSNFSFSNSNSDTRRPLWRYDPVGSPSLQRVSSDVSIIRCLEEELLLQSSTEDGRKKSSLFSTRNNIVTGINGLGNAGLGDSIKFEDKIFAVNFGIDDQIALVKISEVDTAAMIPALLDILLEESPD